MTETAMVHDLQKSATTMKAFRELGVRVALDDFGTGYSSFSYLANLPIDTLKIDRSFLFGIGSDRRQASVLEAIVALAHKLDITVVAEGIEDADQLEAVKNAGCDEVQGFLFARPSLPGVIHHMRGLVNPGDVNPGHVNSRDEMLMSSDLRALGERVQSLPVSVLV
jgi:EAL domain-containing protein (putative c-di-GMP-specific phosphodiesterase class I)